MRRGGIVTQTVDWSFVISSFVEKTVEDQRVVTEDDVSSSLVGRSLVTRRRTG
jgi:hypothetical protein